MTDSTTHMPAIVAEIGKVFGLDDIWRCQCGREHKFGGYAAAHWDEPLMHKCDCGASRTFFSGEVIE